MSFDEENMKKIATEYNPCKREAFVDSLP